MAQRLELHTELQRNAWDSRYPSRCSSKWEGGFVPRDPHFLPNPLPPGLRSGFLEAELETGIWKDVLKRGYPLGIEPTGKSGKRKGLGQDVVSTSI